MTIHCHLCRDIGLVKRYKVQKRAWDFVMCGECNLIWDSWDEFYQKKYSSKLSTEDKHAITSNIETVLVPVGNWWLIWFSPDGDRYVGRTELKNMSFNSVQQIFGLHSNDQYVIHGVYAVSRHQRAVLQQYTHIEFDFDKYAYFVEFEDEYKGHISAENQNYIKDFAP